MENNGAMTSRLPGTVPLLDSSDAEPKAEGRLLCDDDLNCGDKGEGRSDDMDALGLGTGEILGLISLVLSLSNSSPVLSSPLS